MDSGERPIFQTVVQLNGCCDLHQNEKNIKYLGKYESTKLSTLAGCKFNHPILFHIDITNNWQCEADLVHIAVATAPLIKDVVVVALKLICLFLNIRPSTLKAAKRADRVHGTFLGIIVLFNGLPKR